MRYQLINHKISHGKCEVIDWGAGKQHNFKSCDMACTVDTHKKSTTVKKTTSTTWKRIQYKTLNYNRNCYQTIKLGVSLKLLFKKNVYKLCQYKMSIHTLI